MTTEIRQATPGDVDLLLRVIDEASEGVLPALWADYAPEGVDPVEIGRATVLAEEGPFSHRRAAVIERDGKALGALISYPLTGAPDEEPVPPAFEPIKALEAQVAGDWYVNIIGVLPEGRGQGLGAGLMAEAEARARSAGCPAVALIVAANNSAATGFYRHRGFTERDRCPFDVSAYGHAPTEALLMVKPL